MYWSVEKVIWPVKKDKSKCNKSAYRTNATLSKKLEEASELYAEYLSLKRFIIELIEKKLIGKSLIELQDYFDTINELYTVIEIFIERIMRVKEKITVKIITKKISTLKWIMTLVLLKI